MLTVAQTSNYPSSDLVTDSNLLKASILLANHGSGSDKVRKTIGARNVVLVISMRKTRKLGVAVDRKLYQIRNLVDRCFNNVTNAPRVATRCDNKAEGLTGFLDITSIRPWLSHLSN
jgi:hypothetical protein